MQSETEPEDPAATTDPGKLARQLLEQARIAAKQRGEKRVSARRAAQVGAHRRSLPYGPGRDPHSAQKVFANLVAVMGWEQNLIAAKLSADWPEIVGPQLADHCEIVDLVDGRLTLKASSSAWATQLRRLSGRIRHTINSALQNDLVREVTILGPQQRNWKRGARVVRGRGPRDTYG